MCPVSQSAEDELFNLIGSFGQWQKAVFGIFFYVNVIGIWQSYAMTFLTPNVPFRCVEPSESSNVTEWPGPCSVQLPNGTVPCTKWEYDRADYPDTLVNKFDLVCEREWLISFSKSIYMFGFMASVFIFGQVSDCIGRHPTILICCIINCVSLILSMFPTSMPLFLVYRFLLAFGRLGYMTTGFVLLMEIVGPRHRTSVGILIQLGWGCGHCILAFIGYFFRHWFWFQLAISIPVFPLIIVFMFIPESPRWLLMHNKVHRFQKLIIAAAKKNGKYLNEDIDSVIKGIVKLNINGRSERRGNIVDLIRTPNLRYRTFCMMYLWLVNAHVYYAVAYNTNDLSGNPYLNFLLVGVTEFPSYGVLYLSAQRFGRRPTLVSLMLIAGAACLALVAVPAELGWLSTTLLQFGKFCITASFGLLYLYTGELFPTVVRNASLGSCSTVARIGSAVAPFSRELGKYSHPTVPNVLYCVLAVTSGLFALKLPETMGRELPDTLEGGESFAMIERLSSRRRHSATQIGS